jgi:hypothetical protein
MAVRRVRQSDPDMNDGIKTGLSQNDVPIMQEDQDFNNRGASEERCLAGGWSSTHYVGRLKLNTFPFFVSSTLRDREMKHI